MTAIAVHINLGGRSRKFVSNKILGPKTPLFVPKEAQRGGGCHFGRSRFWPFLPEKGSKMAKKRLLASIGPALLDPKNPRFLVFFLFGGGSNLALTLSDSWPLRSLTLGPDRKRG